MIPRTILFLLIGRSTFSEGPDKSNPEALFRVTKDTFRTWPDDSDYNGHMNNAFSHSSPILMEGVIKRFATSNVQLTHISSRQLELGKF